MNILSDNNLDQSLKPFCFNIISDLFIYCPNEAFKFFGNIMQVIGGEYKAFELCSGHIVTIKQIPFKVT